MKRGWSAVTDTIAIPVAEFVAVIPPGSLFFGHHWLQASAIQPSSSLLLDASGG
ncbi:hypothetical protein H6F76_18350 [Leptolyngbya sp. FACHB-321]|uniref:hypothetical protein n=1 Tax=Leptolyngbya sp. FACHB-321 TaxID=2692807 RepID=UPI001681DBC9|nr:hypothetical protein [Leptolyngbya sp. FACHB-321]MBD2036971.1 hypothetical protein [Leptolyngbya sp. FACHB-321]